MSSLDNCFGALVQGSSPACQSPVPGRLLSSLKAPGGERVDNAAAPPHEPSHAFREEDMDAATIDRSKVTEVLADFVVRSAPGDVGAPVYAEAARSFLNWLGCAVGGSATRRSNARSRRSTVLRPRQATVLGRGDRLDIMQRRAHERHHLAHLRLRRHASEDHDPSERAGRLRDPRARRDARRDRARFPACVHPRRRGRVPHRQRGLPEHYDVGWHITGTAGVFGAAAAAGSCSGSTSGR